MRSWVGPPYLKRQRPRAHMWGPGETPSRLGGEPSPRAPSAHTGASGTSSCQNCEHLSFEPLVLVGSAA